MLCISSLFSVDKCALQIHRLIQPFNTFFLSCQSLTAPQNLSPTQTCNPIYHSRKKFNFSDKGIPSSSVLKAPNETLIKRLKEYSPREF